MAISQDTDTNPLILVHSYTYPLYPHAAIVTKGILSTHLVLLVLGLVIDVHGCRVIDVHGLGVVGLAGGWRHEEAVVARHEEQADLQVAVAALLRPA